MSLSHYPYDRTLLRSNYPQEEISGENSATEMFGSKMRGIRVFNLSDSNLTVTINTKAFTVPAGMFWTALYDDLFDTVAVSGTGNWILQGVR